MLFGRVKSLEAILATAEKKSLHRSLGPFQLTLLGIGAVIGTGIFVLTAEAAQKAGPAMVLSFCIAGFVCAVAALCYSELASMVPVAGSAYTYTYAVVGELMAWMVGWALILEYAVGASAVAVGWSNHAVGLLHGLGVDIPAGISNADALMAKVQMAFGAAPTADLLTAANTGGWINIPAVLIAGAVTWLLVIGTTESARVNSILVLIKIAALTLFIALTIPVLRAENFTPFMPTGAAGTFGAAASDIMPSPPAASAPRAPHFTTTIAPGGIPSRISRAAAAGSARPLTMAASASLRRAQAARASQPCMRSRFRGVQPSGGHPVSSATATSRRAAQSNSAS